MGVKSYRYKSVYNSVVDSSLNDIQFVKDVSDYLRVGLNYYQTRTSDNKPSTAILPGPLNAVGAKPTSGFRSLKASLLPYVSWRDFDNDLLHPNSRDRIFGETGSDDINGQAGNDQLFGGDDVDTLKGGEGNVKLYGEAGSDVLTGGMGNDSFYFDQLLATTGIDRITDFSPGLDKLVLSSVLYSQLSIVNQFESIAGSSTANVIAEATRSNTRIVYNSNNGALSYDIDGTGTSPGVQIATLSKFNAYFPSDVLSAQALFPALTASDFNIG